MIAVTNRGTFFYSFHFNQIFTVRSYGFSGAVSIQIPLPRVKPIFPYPVVYITKRMKIQNSYFALGLELLNFVKGFSLVMNWPDVMMMRTACQSDVVLRLASLRLWSAVISSAYMTTSLAAKL